MASTYLDINPRVLRWARERAHFPEADLAKKATVKLDRYLQWETGEAKPTLRQFRKLVRALNRPLQLFFMSDIPEEPEILAEMRRLPGVPVGEESPELTGQIHLVLERRDIALRLHEDLGQSPPDINYEITTSQDPESVAQSLRQYLGVSMDEQVRWDNPHQAIRGWRSVLESFGVLVFQIPKVSIEEMRGFSISLRPLPIIGANTADYPRPRIFTIFHEFVHILLRETVLHAFRPRWFQIDPTIEVEQFCNKVAGALLVPESGLKDQVQDLGKHRSDNWDDNEISLLSNRFHVSRDVIIRRLRKFDFISQDSFEILRDNYDSFGPPPRGGSTGGNFYGTKIAHMGTLVPQLAFRSFYSNKLTTSDLSTLFGLKVKNLGRLEERLFGASYGFKSV